MPTWRIDGAGFSYTFAPEFDLISYDRTINSPGQAIHRGEGVQIDVSTVTRRPTVHVMRGLLQKSSVAASLRELDLLRAAVNAMPDEVYLTDVEANRRVAVKMISSDIPRDPARTLNVSLSFRTSDVPYFEDYDFTTVTATIDSWTDITTGDVPSWSEMVFAGRFTNPSIVQGNWSFVSHVDSLLATCINSGTDSSPWGQIRGTFLNQIIYSATAKFGTSIGLFKSTIQDSGDLVQFYTMNDRSDPSLATKPTSVTDVADRINFSQFTLAGWVNTNWNWDDDKEHYFFQAAADSTNQLNAYKSTSNKLVVQFGNTTLSYPNSSSNLANLWHHIAFRGSTKATIEGNYLDMFVNGSLVTSFTTKAATMTRLPQLAYVGGKSNAESSGDALFDDWGLWGEALSSSVIKSTLYNSGTGIRASRVNDRTLLTYFNFDGTGGSAVATNLSGQTISAFNFSRPESFYVTALSNDTLINLRRNADNIFSNNDPIAIIDELGWVRQIHVDGTVSPSTVRIDNGSGSSVGSVAKVGVYLNLNGSSDYAAGSSLMFDIKKIDQQVGIWFSRDGLPTTVEALIDKRGNQTSIGWQVYITTTGSLVMRMDDGTDDGKIFVDYNAELDGKWHNTWLIMKRAGGSEIFVDGQLKSTTIDGTLPTLSITNAQSLTIGAFSGGNTAFFNGQISQIRMIKSSDSSDYSTATQVRFFATNIHSYTSGWTPSGSSLNDYWEMTENTGLTAAANNSAQLNLTLSTSGMWQRRARISPNILSDPNFENGSIGGWNIPIAVGQTILKKITSQWGGKVLQMERPTTNNRWGVQQVVRVLVGQNWAWRGRYRKDTLGANPRVEFSIGDGVTNELLFSDSINVATVWRTFEVAYERVALGQNEDLFFSGKQCQMELDSFEFIASGFDDGGFERWDNANTLTNWTESEDGSSVIKRSTDIHSWDFAAAASIDSSNAVITLQQTVSVGTNQLFNFGVWAKADSLTGTPQLRVKEKVTSDSSFTNHTHTLTTAYQRFTVFLKSKGVATPSIQISNGTGCSSRLITIDDATFTKMYSGQSFLTTGGNNESRIEPSKYGFGRKIIGDEFTFASLIQRTEKFASMVRFRAVSAWSTAANQALMYLYDLNDGSSALGTHHYEMFIRDGRYVFGHSGASITAQATAYALNKDIDVSVWVDTAGTVVSSGSTIRAKLFENGLQIKSTATFTALAVNTLTKLFIGSNRNTDEPATQIMDEVYFWQQSIGDTFLKGEQNAQRRLVPDNRVFKWRSTVATVDYLIIDHQNETVKLMNTSGPTIQEAKSNNAGEFFQLGEGNAHGHANQDTLFTRQVGFTRLTNYRKLYY